MMLNVVEKLLNCDVQLLKLVSPLPPPPTSPPPPPPPHSEKRRGKNWEPEKVMLVFINFVQCFVLSFVYSAILVAPKGLRKKKITIL